MYAFLLQWSISVVEVKALEKPAPGAPAKGRGMNKGSKAKAPAKDGTWDSTRHLQTALDHVQGVEVETWEDLHHDIGKRHFCSFVHKVRVLDTGE